MLIHGRAKFRIYKADIFQLVSQLPFPAHLEKKFSFYFTFFDLYFKY